jgi:glutamate dehydrogenase
VWVAKRAEIRGLEHAATLMSSKPGSGINHKEFGVTSEGIFRWVSVVLPLIGVTNDDAYTVKMTGGPDGDVAGNMLKIMHREHGERVKVVAISDGTGALHDADGLDWA